MAPPKCIREFMKNMDESQKANLRALREKLKDVLEDTDDDFLLCRFLKARSFDLTKAEKLLREHLQFRKKMQLEMGKDFEPTEFMEAYSSWAVLGNDKDGDPVSYSYISGFDFKGISYSVPLPEQMKYVNHVLKIHLKSSTKTSHEAMGTFIFDIKDISLSHVTSQMVLRQHLSLINMYLSNYPETMKACFIINAPPLFHIAYNLYKHLLDSNMLQKMFICGKDGFQEPLRKMMNHDILPAFLGGKMTDPDGNEYCHSLCNHGFMKIPTSYYMSNEAESPEPDGVIDVCIKERASYDYRVRVDEANTTLAWYFRTINYNIKFGIYYVSDDVPQTPKLNRKYAKASDKTLKKAGFEPVFAVEFVESHVIPERGEYNCDKTGTYVFRFDNSFSWMTPKELRYKVSVLPPKESKHVKENKRVVIINGDLHK